jgi:hypothetical protein
MFKLAQCLLALNQFSQRSAHRFVCAFVSPVYFAPHSQKVVIGFDTFSGFSSDLADATSWNAVVPAR